MDATTVRNALVEGRFGEILAALGADERWNFDQLSFVPGHPDGTGCLARVGRMIIVVQGQGVPGQESMQVQSYPTEAAACDEWAQMLPEFREQTEQGNHAAMLARQDPRAQALLRMGMPVPLVGQALLDQEQVSQAPDTDAMPVRELPPVGVVRMDDGNPTGSYL